MRYNLKRLGSCAIWYMQYALASPVCAHHLMLDRWEQKINTRDYCVRLPHWSLGWIKTILIIKMGPQRGKKKHMSISYRRPHTKGWRSPNSSVLASVIWNTTLCRSEIPTSMSSSMPTSSPEWHMTNRLTVMMFASSFVFSTMVTKPQQYLDKNTDLMLGLLIEQ